MKQASRYSIGQPATCYVDQARLELRDLPVSASQVLGLKVCSTAPGFGSFLAIAQPSRVKSQLTKSARQ